MKKHFKIYILIIVPILALFLSSTVCIASSTAQNSPEYPEYQDITLSMVVEGELYCYVNDLQEFEYFGNLESYGCEISTGIVIIKWGGNVLGDEQEIVSVFSVTRMKELFIKWNKNSGVECFHTAVFFVCEAANL